MKYVPPQRLRALRYLQIDLPFFKATSILIEKFRATFPINDEEPGVNYGELESGSKTVRRVFVLHYSEVNHFKPNLSHQNMNKKAQ